MRMSHPYINHSLRTRLVETSLEWEGFFGVMPRVTSELSEFDAAMLIGHTPDSYSKEMQGATAVRQGFDFHFQNNRYQIKANRPSGKPGSKVSLVGKARNFDWDRLIWILYDRHFAIQECWQWDVAAYRNGFETLSRLSPLHMRKGEKLL